jgi:hypothetical protein
MLPNAAGAAPRARSRSHSRQQRRVDAAKQRQTLPDTSGSGMESTLAGPAPALLIATVVGGSQAFAAKFLIQSSWGSEHLVLCLALGAVPGRVHAWVDLGGGSFYAQPLQQRASHLRRTPSFRRSSGFPPPVGPARSHRCRLPKLCSRHPAQEARNARRRTV